MHSRTGAKKRVRNGQGRLYKRTRDGKEHPADSKVRGIFWFSYYTEGRRVRQKLLNEDGTPVATLREAEQLQKKILTPLVAGTRERQLRSIRNQLEDIEEEKSEKLPALNLTGVWNEFYRSHNRPASGERTLMGYQSQLKAFTDWMQKVHPQVKEMREVSTRHAEAYADQLESCKFSPSTYNQHLNTLSLIWAVLTQKARLSCNPFAWDKKTRTGIRRKSIKAEVCIRKKRALTIEEINTLIDHATGDFKTLLIILACTGQRLVDGVKLKWESIDFEKKIITLIPQKTAARTGKQVFIPMLPQLVEELEECRRTDAYVLPELVALYDRDSGSTLSKHIRKIFDDAKLTGTKSLDTGTKRAVVATGAHSLRHSFVTIARMAGFPDPLIRQITGHSSQEMVDHYTQFSEKLVATLAAQIPQAGRSQKAIGEKLKEPVPEWVKEELKTMIENNWKQIRDALTVEL